MTWNTPLGHRVLEGIEGRIMRGALCRLSREIIESPEDEVMCVGVAVFDAMTGCQQLVMLDYVQRFLFEDTSESNEMSAIVEGTVAAVLAYVSVCIEFELDLEEDLSTSIAKTKPKRYWRELIQQACGEYEWELSPSPVLEDWAFAIERLHDRILYDRDYEMDFTDEQPEDSQAVNSALGIPKAYFTSIPLAEPDGPQMLEVIRRLLN
jgi:hypothetical protein